ncbi:FASTKD3 [Symbiodinium sp. KB8]|nr:FASTKD3 [Symbiodinium sp. KB8]
MYSPAFDVHAQILQERVVQCRDCACALACLVRRLSGPLADEDGNVPTGEDRPIAIEVDGPSHFYANSKRYTAYTKLKHRLLTRMGYKVLHVPYYEWRSLRGAVEREDYMRKKLQEEPTEWLDPEDEKYYMQGPEEDEEEFSVKPEAPAEVGNRPPWSFKNEVIQSWEGVVCEVTRLHNRTASRAFENAFGKWYAWFHSNLWESEDVITLQKDGSAVTSRGMGKWHLDRSQERAMTLEWPSHKTTAMGGRNAAPPVQELWYLRFDEDWEKFAAMRVDGAVATGVDQEVMHAIVRRLFVSASHEFCSSAKECGQRLQA